MKGNALTRPGRLVSSLAPPNCITTGKGGFYANFANLHELLDLQAERSFHGSVLECGGRDTAFDFAMRPENGGQPSKGHARAQSGVNAAALQNLAAVQTVWKKNIQHPTPNIELPMKRAESWQSNGLCGLLQPPSPADAGSGAPRWESYSAPARTMIFNESGVGCAAKATAFFVSANGK
jgi:hypothetical protein